jgi:hypothetical protein
MACARGPEVWSSGAEYIPLMGSCMSCVLLVRYCLSNRHRPCSPLTCSVCALLTAVLECSVCAMLGFNYKGTRLAVTSNLQWSPLPTCYVLMSYHSCNRH